MMGVAVLIPKAGFAQQDSTRLLESSVESWMLQMDDLENEENVSEEVLGTLGQVHDSLEVDDLGRGLGDIGKRLREQLQIVHVLFYFVSLVHCVSVFADATCKHPRKKKVRVSPKTGARSSILRVQKY